MTPQNKVASEYNRLRSYARSTDSHTRAISMRFFKRASHKADRKQARLLIATH